MPQDHPLIELGEFLDTAHGAVGIGRRTHRSHDRHSLRPLPQHTWLYAAQPFGLLGAELQRHQRCHGRPKPLGQNANLRVIGLGCCSGALWPQPQRHRDLSRPQPHRDLSRPQPHRIYLGPNPHRIYLGPNPHRDLLWPQPPQGSIVAPTPPGSIYSPNPTEIYLGPNPTGIYP